MKQNNLGLIDRAALVQEVNRDIDRCYTLGIGAVGPLSNFLDQIQRQPTVDAVEVVRCKDCAWYNEFDRCVNPKCVKSYHGAPVPPEHFCGYGERDD